MHCPNCGREVAELIEGFCPDCASRRLPLVEAPQALTLARCAHCGRFQVGLRWVTPPGDPLATVLDQLRGAFGLHPDLKDPHMEFETTQQDPTNLRVEARVEGSFHGIPVERAAAVQVRLQNAACPDCSRQYGGYFEATLQIRGPQGKSLEDVDGPRRTAETILERLARDDRSGAFFSKIEEQRGGLDLRVGSKEIARILARELADRWGAETNESASLVGRSRTGQDLVRTTFLLRLPPYGLGDFVETEEGLFKIEGIQRRRLLLFDLAHRRTIGRDPHRIEALKVIGRTTDELDAVVVSHTGSRLQLLDPITLATVDLEAPPDIEIGSSVRVFRHDERLWIVGPPPQAKA